MPKQVLRSLVKNAFMSKMVRTLRMTTLQFFPIRLGAINLCCNKKKKHSIESAASKVLTKFLRQKNHFFDRSDRETCRIACSCPLRRKWDRIG